MLTNLFFNSLRIMQEMGRIMVRHYFLLSLSLTFYTERHRDALPDDGSGKMGDQRRGKSLFTFLFF